MVEEFPNTFMRSSTALTAFRSAILQFLASSTPSLAAFGQGSSADPIIPVVMVISGDPTDYGVCFWPIVSRHTGSSALKFFDIPAPVL